MAHGPVTFARYTGQESEEDRQQIKAEPPDVLLTNFVAVAQAVPVRIPARAFPKPP
jgi:ATP-dependent helicase YprA (DUF1998 family)